MCGRGIVLGALLILAPLTAAPVAIDLDVTPQDIERALAIARSREVERARFHAPYIRRLNTTFIESVEVVSEYRRVVLLAEDRARKGDRMFGYSVTLAQQAVATWHRRLSIIARLRFHPQNTFVGVPPVDIVLSGRDGARIGVLKEPVLALPSNQPGERQTVLGAVVEGVFDAALVPAGVREFTIVLDGKEVGHVSFDLGILQ